MWTPLLASHAAAALVALGLGAWQLFGSAKGTPAHRLIGRVWVGLMLFVAVSSFWITEIRPGRFSALHILSAVTIVTVTLGLVAAVRGQVLAHRGHMTGSWLGLVGAFVFAVAIPSRHVPQFVLTEPLGAATAGAAIVLTTAAVVIAGHLLAPASPRGGEPGAAKLPTGRAG
ncbi:DUF2306 domain-containing protein [Aeromicrobium camelliae]|uniref:DUF2306 domain-containing protein n=1 Tax=Aeromicrobium camelliae TaxID=1538144 RepID=A0A3N6WUB3_9ACTN|nr:DUF2306 domain-containing protein [Aeromicrobium camelliae]RQN08562.1 DUF2306 domain-containing protein [Aeromicrobium camelliae]